MNYIRKSRHLIHVAEDSCCKKLEGCILGNYEHLKWCFNRTPFNLGIFILCRHMFLGCPLTLAVRFFAWWKVPILAHGIHETSFVRSWIVTISVIYYWEKVLFLGPIWCGFEGLQLRFPESPSKWALKIGLVWLRIWTFLFGMLQNLLI